MVEDRDTHLRQPDNSRTGLEIAVIGMAARFPGAGNVEEFWENLKNGVESISFFSQEEAATAGVEPRLLQQPGYVRAWGVLEDIEFFDAPFFNYTPVEADAMDPQIRLFHQCAWHALEDAGYDPFSFAGQIGLFAGFSPNLWWRAGNFLRARSASEQFGAKYLNSDYFCTLICYRLNLKGPGVTLHTACSTSLAAIHTACRSLLTGEADMALAGGVTVTLPQQAGYLYQEGMIASSDGHCRAFAAGADGTTMGNGLGIVVLKPLAAAESDGDHIYAVIKGSAVNNDGQRKGGYTVPSIEGQVEVLEAAQHLAETAPGTITYVEAHGTGTALGDPIEVEALTRAFHTDKRGFCRIGSVKTNVGHLDTAAGAAGFIKTVLALSHRLIPPSLNFDVPNPRIDFAHSPFLVNDRLSQWRVEGHPRRAAVSAFGIGGTNAHVILEEYRQEDAAQPAPPGPGYPFQLIVLSARTEAALEKMTRNLAGYFTDHPHVNLADAAYTLQVGRRPFRQRRMLVCSAPAEAAAVLAAAHDPASPRLQQLHTAALEKEHRPLVFMFPGQGSQYVGMGRELYERVPLFRREMDRCFDILGTLINDDLKDMWLPGVNRDVGDADLHPLEQTEAAQPLLFVFEYALAKLLMKWGLKPEAMIGHSIGELTAAHLAGVFSLEDALQLVVQRGRLMQSIPTGAMLSVPLPEEELTPLLNDTLSLAAVNTPGRCVISGGEEAIDDLTARLQERGIDSRRLHTSHAFHSPLMEAIIPAFEERAAEVTYAEPQIPYISNVSGTWIRPEQACDPAYYARQLRQTVRFSAGLAVLLTEPDAIFLEVGPGQTLGSFTRQHPARTSNQPVVNLVRHPREKASDLYILLERLGRLWLFGLTPDWSACREGERRQRIALPLYPFERQAYRVKSTLPKGTSVGSGPVTRRADIDDWFYLPSWRGLDLPQPVPQGPPPRTWLLLTDSGGLGEKLRERLLQLQQQVVTIQAGSGWQQIDSQAFGVNPGEPADYETLMRELAGRAPMPLRVVHLWGVDDDDGGMFSLEGLDRLLDLNFYSLLHLARALGHQADGRHIRIDVVSNHLHQVEGDDRVRARKAAVLAAVRGIPLEYPHTTCRSIEVESRGRADNGIDPLVEELFADSSEPVVALRRRHRWVQRFEPVRLAEPDEASLPLKPGGVYWITGGLGGIGLSLAAYLARHFQARLILSGRRQTPPPEAALKLKELRADGAEILLAPADVADRRQVKEVLTMAVERFGGIDGVIHAAGIADEAGVIQRRNRQQTEAVLSAKVRGTLILDELLRQMKLEPEFFLLCSSLSAVIAPFGQVGYGAANAFLDAFARQQAVDTPGSRFSTIAVDWDAWQEVGMAVRAVGKTQLDEPLEGERIPLQGHYLFAACIEAAPGRTIFVSYFSTATHWLLAEHRIEGRAALPGTAYLEMALAAVLHQAPEGSAYPLELRDVCLLAPLTVAGGEEREVHTVLKREAAGWSFSIRSRGVPEQTGWQDHARGTIVPVELPAPDAVDIGEIQDRCRIKQDSPARNTGPAERWIEAGPRWQSRKQVWMGRREGLIRLELPPAFKEDMADYRLHPALMDAATAFLAVPFQEGQPYLPFLFKRVSVKARLGAALFSFARCLETPDSRHSSLSFDVTVMDERGQKLVEVEGFTLVKVSERPERAGSAADRVLRYGIRPAEGAAVFRRILSFGLGRFPQVVVSTTDLSAQPERTAVPRPPDSPAAAETEVSAGPKHPRPQLSTPYAAPRNRTEQALARIWQDFFGIRQVGIFDDFFEMGGDSLKALTMLAGIQRELGVDISITHLFNHPSIHGLAERIDGAEKRHFFAIPPLEQREYYPLSSAQKRLYFLQQMHPDNVFYNLPHAVRLEGELDRERLDRAFRALLRRHESLRTSFKMIGGEAVQVVHRPGDVDPRIQYTGAAAESAAAVVERFVRPFDLECPPLLRMQILCTGEKKYIWLFDIHHIITDATGYAILIKDLLPLYQGRELPPLKIQYRDFSNWQNEQFAAGRLRQQEAYWLEQLADAPRIPRLNLPYDYPRPENFRFKGGSSLFDLEGEEKARFDTLTAETGATLFINLVAALKVLLFKYTGRQDIVIGSSIAGRGHADLQDILGMFVNLLALRSRLDEGMTYRELLQRVRLTCLEAFENQDMQFDMLVRKLGLETDSSRNPLFDVCINVQNYEQPAPASRELKIEPYGEYRTAAAKFDLLLWAFETKGAIRFNLEYSSELFKKSTAEKLGQRYMEIIRQVSLQPDIRLKEIKVSHRLLAAASDMPSMDFGF